MRNATELARALLLAAAVAAILIVSVHAQSPEQVVSEIRFEQKLDQNVPLDTAFADETGRSVQLREFFGSRPVIIAMVYYECPLLCNAMLNGVTSTLKTISLNPGADFEVIVVSIDPTEKPELAAKKKTAYVGSYGRPGTKKGWHFLTGSQDSIRSLSQSIGFNYVYDPASGQYAHSSGIVVLTPEGRIARYFFGLEFSARDLRLGLVEASAGKIGNLADQVLLYCYSYNPVEAKYGFAIMSALRAFAVLTFGCMAGFVAIQLRRERRSRGGVAPASDHRGAGVSPASAVGLCAASPDGSAVEGKRDARPTKDDGAPEKTEARA